MNLAARNLGGWVFCVLALALACPTGAVAQKFARRTNPLPSTVRLTSAADDAPATLSVEENETIVVEEIEGQVKRAAPTWQANPRDRVRPMAGQRFLGPSRGFNSGPRYVSASTAREFGIPASQILSVEEHIVGEEMPTPAQSEEVAPGQAAPPRRAFAQGGDGEIVYEGDGPILDGGPGGCTNCGFGDEHVCGPDCGPDCPYARVRPCDGICIPRYRVDETSLFIGPQAFTAPIDQGRNGNFGFHEGVNFAGQFGRRLGLGFLGIGYQIGAQFVQSNFNGFQTNGLLDKGRDQQFITAGLYRRALEGRGWQGGAVYDYLHDNYYTKFTVAQVRGELSYLTPCGHEFGFWGAFNVRNGTGTINGLTTTISTVDMYNLFYRYTTPTGSQGRIWGGATGSRGGIVGADFRVVITNRWDLMGAFNYLIPTQGTNLVGSTNQGFGMMLNLVWYPGRRLQGNHNTPFRQLFNVADNTTLFSTLK